MVLALSEQIEEIFVGRHAELKRLASLLEFTQEFREHFVYVLLNAPGVGKTTLLRQFGAMLESKGEEKVWHVRKSYF